MAQHIIYSPPTGKKGAVYATVVKSIRNGNKVGQERILYLGTVIDKEKGIYKNRERGVYRFNLKEGFLPLDDSVEEHVLVSQAEDKEELILEFGNSFLLYQYINKFDFYSVYHDLVPKGPELDTLMSLIFFRILESKEANDYALPWWNMNYARLLFPEARLAGPRISEFLVRLGSESTQRKFFDGYLSALYGKTKETPGVLIDSTGVPNATGMSITQLSNHNGDVNMEVRLIYVIDRRDGTPIYYRYCSGNIIDVSTLCTTMAELSQYGIAINYAIMDAGYVSEKNLEELFKSEIPFVTRIAPNRKVYKEVVAEELSDLTSSKYSVDYGDRDVNIKRVETEICGHKVYAYLGIDMDTRHQKYKRTKKQGISDKLSFEEIDRKLAELGVFLILSSEYIETSEVLRLYYTRQKVEQVFDITKNYADLLPIRVHDEETFRGHLMITFMATVILHKLQQEVIAKRKKTDKINQHKILYTARGQMCKVYKNAVIPQEAVREVNEAYRILDIKCPCSIPRSTVRNVV